MDSQLRLDWYKSNIIDKRWMQDSLPHGEAEVPVDELPDQEASDQGPSLTVKEAEKKWTDTGLAAVLASAR